MKVILSFFVIAFDPRAYKLRELRRPKILFYCDIIRRKSQVFSKNLVSFFTFVTFFADFWLFLP